MTRTKLASLRTGLATGCLGADPVHTLEDKFRAIQESGFKLVELRIGDYIGWVRQRHPKLQVIAKNEDEPDPSDEIIWQTLNASAEDLQALAHQHGLQITMLQPLNHFDGWPNGHKRHDWSRRKAERWLKLSSCLRVDILQVGSNNLPEANGGDAKIADDLKWLAGIGARQNPPVKIAYESWSHSPHVSSWEHTWKLVKDADHPNLGLCLDVAQFCQSAEYGWDVLKGTQWTDEAYDAMLGRLRLVPKDKIFYVEISDMVSPDPPLGKGSDFDQWYEANQPDDAKQAWILCARPVPLVGRNAGKLGKTGVDLGARVVRSLSAILDTGYEGPVIFEFFEMMRMEQPDPQIPFEYAQACERSLELVKAGVDGRD